VLVNRKLDVDGSDGMDVIRSAFACDNLSGMPFMLVFNYDDAQNQAVAAGARPGFGKAELGDPDVVLQLAATLGVNRCDTNQ